MNIMYYYVLYTVLSTLYVLNSFNFLQVYELGNIISSKWKNRAVKSFVQRH